jgi:hypothetical protein
MISGRVFGRGISLDAALFACSIGVYLGTRFVGLTAFPISFLGDEAVQVVDAADLLDRNFRDEYGDVFPTYLRNGPYLNLGTSVYLHVLPYALFGYSVFAARAVTVLFTLFGAVALALLLRDVFRIRFWWTGILLLSIVPAWFLHSRMALEAGTGCAFYSWFLYLYLRFRTSGSAWSLYGSVACGAVAFYSYAPLKLVVLATATLFAVADIRWLVMHRAVVLRAAILAAALALPELRFQVQHPDASLEQLRVLGSYVVDPKLGLLTKVDRFVHEYGLGLDPRYWFDPGQTRDVSRHAMKGYGHMLPATLPLAAVGLARAVRHAREPAHRGLLLATAAAPLGAAAVEIAMPRVLVVVVPVTVLVALGLDAVLDPLAVRTGYRLVAVSTAMLLIGVNVGMLADALRSAPTWYTDYGLYGMQYGGRQVTRAIADELDRAPGVDFAVSPDWANGTDTLVRFFLPDEGRVRTVTIDEFLHRWRAGIERTMFVMTPEELLRTRRSTVFEDVRVLKTVDLPDGRAGFYFVRLRYSPRAAAMIAAVRAARRRPITETVTLSGTRAIATHSPFDTGSGADLFDGDTFTLARTRDTNTLEIRLQFSRARPLSEIRVVGRDAAVAVEAHVSAIHPNEELVLRGFNRDGTRPSVELDLARPLLVRALVLRISDPSDRDLHVHVNEIELR